MFTAKNLAVGASIILMATLVYIASLGLWVTRDLADSERFAEHTVAAFEVDSSRVAMSELMVDKIADGRPLLTVASPLLVDFMAGLLDGQRLQTLLTRIAAELHSIMFDGEQRGIVIDLTTVGETIMPPLEQLFPQLAAEIPDGIFQEFVLVEPGTVPELSAYAKAARALTWVAIILALALGVVMIWLRPVKWKGGLAIGIGMVVGGLVSILTIGNSRSITLGVPKNPNVEVLIANLYDETVRSLKSFAWWVLIIGLVVIVVSLVYGNSLKPSGDDAGEATSSEDPVATEAT
jgi:hypothetical protein